MVANVPAANVLAVLTTVAAHPPGLSAETGMRLEAMVNHAVKAASARAPSAATTMAERPGTIPPADSQVWAAERTPAVAAEGFTGAGAAAVVDRTL